ncbi:DUF6188 family protein [Rhodococcoides fascians]|uniref:DUF6188 family protein n=1 Tax=Rhodococcoides fascians TaxID=1828 RepID=UPI0034D3C8AB
MVACAHATEDGKLWIQFADCSSLRVSLDSDFDAWRIAAPKASLLSVWLAAGFPSGAEKDSSRSRAPMKNCSLATKVILDPAHVLAVPEWVTKVRLCATKS